MDDDRHLDSLIGDAANALRLVSALQTGDDVAWQQISDHLDENGRTRYVLTAMASLMVRLVHETATRLGCDAQDWLSQWDEARYWLDADTATDDDRIR